MYDLIIIGAGAAGITAAIYAKRSNLNFEILSKDIGGLTLWSPDIENYTGYHHLSGIELIEKFKEHMADYNINIRYETVQKISKKKDCFIVKTDEKEYETKTAIICSGSSPRKLGIPGSDQFEGKGLAYCATCDGPLFAGKEVAVVGGGDSAIAAALSLLQVVKKVYILNFTDDLTAKDMTMKDKVLKNSKVSVINNAKTLEVLGDELVTGIVYEQKGQKKTLNVEGIFVEIGHARNIDFAKGVVKMTEREEIIVDREMQTSVPGIFAAGDVNDIPGKQTIISAGDGAKAFLSALRFIQKSR